MGHFVWPPVGEEALCGAWRASTGSRIDVRREGSFSAVDVPFADSAISGSGSWEFGQGASVEGVLTLRFEQARASLEVRTRRDLSGALRLLVNDPESDEEELQYLKEGSCGLESR
ncbi:hypothetical protein ACIA59_05410 [Micromonospora haikouensis]|uniref:hypothetical protein n=1 Tax=Micromonospora haikouensis TaxID=686309 RepID=UPI0037B31F4C